MDNVLIPTFTKEIGGMKHKFSPNGLVVHPSISFQEWDRLGRSINAFRQATRWWLADWLVFGEGKFGEMASQVTDELGYDYQTLANWKWTAGQVPVSRRREKLSFSHHQEVARLDPPDQTRWLEKAEQNNWTREELRSQLSNAGSAQVVRSINIASLQLRIDGESVVVALEHRGVWRDVVVEDLETVREKRKVLPASAIMKLFE